MIFPMRDPGIEGAMLQAQAVFFRPIISPKPTQPTAPPPAPRPTPPASSPDGGRGPRGSNPGRTPGREPGPGPLLAPGRGPRRIPKPQEDLCVGECPDKKCRTLVVCFEPGQGIDQTEFARQMELQEDGLNRMTPTAMLQNRAAFLANPDAMRRKADPLGEQARLEFAKTRHIRAAYEVQDGAGMGFLALNEDISGRNSRLVALHNPDMVAGGTYNSVIDASTPIENRIGTRSANSSLGKQWNSRADRVEDHARRQEENGCPTVQVNLRVCQSRPRSPGEPLNPDAVPPAGPRTRTLPWGPSNYA